MMIRRLGLAAVLAVFIGSSSAVGQTTKTSAFSGQIPEPANVNVMVWVFTSGDLPGYFTFTCTRNLTTIGEGTWVLDNRIQQADGSEEWLGMLEGRITGGTAKVSKSGAIVSLSGVKLTVDRGTGNFASVSTGSGTVDGSVSGGTSFSGMLRLTF